MQGQTESIERADFGPRAREVDFDGLAGGMLLTDQFAATGVLFQDAVVVRHDSCPGCLVAVYAPT